MRYNENISNEYGTFFETMGESPLPSKPTLTKNDYAKGSIKRAFAKKINDNRIVEIAISQVGSINPNLYRVVVINWTIRGIRENRTVDGIVEYGVSNLNKLEISKVSKEEGINLSPILTNTLEYWQGN
jgi:hypothetical protein